MQFIGFMIFGLIVGLIARLLLPGPDKMGIIKTTLLGIGGAALGGWIGQQTGMYPQGSPVGFGMALLGALIVLIGYNILFGRRA